MVIFNQLASIGEFMVVHKSVNPGLTEVFMIGVSYQQAAGITTWFWHFRILSLCPTLVCIAEYRVANTEAAKKVLIAFLNLTPLRAFEFVFSLAVHVFLIITKGKSAYSNPYVDTVSAVASFLHHFRARSLYLTFNLPLRFLCRLMTCLVDRGGGGEGLRVIFHESCHIDRTN